MDEQIIIIFLLRLENVNVHEELLITWNSNKGINKANFFGGVAGGGIIPLLGMGLYV